MFKTVSSVVAALACVALASPSHAQSFSPSSGTVTTSMGMVRIQQSTSTNCRISMPVLNMTPTSISIPVHSLSPFTPGDLLCYWATTYGPWAAYVVPGDTTKVDIKFGFSQTAPCYGTIRADWNDWNRTATFTNAFLPAVSGLQDCTVTGTISVPGLTIVP